MSAALYCFDGNSCYAMTVSTVCSVSSGVQVASCEGKTATMKLGSLEHH